MATGPEGLYAEAPPTGSGHRVRTNMTTIKHARIDGTDLVVS